MITVEFLKDITVKEVEDATETNIDRFLDYTEDAEKDSDNAEK
nr:MAG TPA: hypothetical protein [Caudoviricetes sp.]